MPKCPRTKCHEKAIIHPTYNILPCQKCQRNDVRISSGRKCEFANIGKLHRIQEQRDLAGADLLQPYEGGKANVDFFKNYPDRVEDYGVRAELRSEERRVGKEC